MSPPDGPIDLVLSSGFLAFGRQSGFLQAVEESGLAVDGICGTSSGALAGALWASGKSARQIHDFLCAAAPIRSMKLSSRPWQGLFSMHTLIARLREELPLGIEDLGRPFGIGLAEAGGRSRVHTEGPLAELVAASCAMPRVFVPIEHEGSCYWDGGAVCRTGLPAWQALRGERPILLHHVQRTAGKLGAPDFTGICRVSTPRSGARFWALGDTLGRMEEARTLTWAALEAHGWAHRSTSGSTPARS